MCENNTLFLSRAWRYFLVNGHTVVDGMGEVDLVFVGGCAVTDAMRRRCEGMILKSNRLDTNYLPHSFYNSFITRSQSDLNYFT